MWVIIVAVVVILIEVKNTDLREEAANLTLLVTGIGNLLDVVLSQET